jgi:hypothetical protein
MRNIYDTALQECEYRTMHPKMELECPEPYFMGTGWISFPGNDSVEGSEVVNFLHGIARYSY